MSKSLKKLIDINRLREFKNKLVGAGSAYVQTGAVDQTVAGTKTFSKPIAGSVTGSSGSCTGNAATATTATTAKACTGNAATATKATGNANGKELTNTIIKGLSISGKTITYTQIDGNTGTLTTQDTVYTHPTTAGNKHIPSGGSSGQFLGWASDGTAKWVNNPNTNTDTLMTQNVSTTNATYPVLLVATADATANQGAKTGIFAKSVKVNPSTNVISASGFSGPLTGNVTGNCSGSSGSCTGNAATATTATTAKACTGNAATATKLVTARSLWGNSFDGSAAITGAITGTPSIEFKPVATTSNNGGFLDFHYNQSTADYTSRIIESASGTLSINNVTITTGKVVTATTFNGALTGNVTGNCSGSSGSCTGNAATATKLAAKRTIALSGAATGTATGFDGSGNITIPVTSLASSAIRTHILSMVYPVGSVYISVNDVSPEKFLGGKWAKISQGRVLQGVSGNQTAGTEVSAGLPNISVSSNGEHTHTRGSMNITGDVVMHGAGSGCTVIYREDGAFYGSSAVSAYNAPNCVGGVSSEGYINFSADRTWTGSTSSDGAHSHNAYIANITGNSTTVQPPALLVNIWKRTA